MKDIEESNEKVKRAYMDVKKLSKRVSSNKYVVAFIIIILIIDTITD
jgi:hypothetical protein